MVIAKAAMRETKIFALLDILFEDLIKSVYTSLADVPFQGKLIVASREWRHLPLLVPHSGRVGMAMAF